MKTKVINTIFAVAFMFMLLIPAVFIHPSGGIASEQENSMLANRPHLADMRHSPSDFIARFDDWFADNAGFRESLIGLYAILNSIEHQTQYREGYLVYLIGEQGHRFFGGIDGELIPKFQGKRFLTDDQLLTLSNWLGQTKRSLDERNIPFVVMFCTDKESVYPEFYPSCIVRIFEPFPLDVITDYLKEHTDVDVFSIRQRLLAEKENHLLYNKSSGDLRHYNDIGAFFTYAELMEHILLFFPDMIPFTRDDIEITFDADEIPLVTLKAKTSFQRLDASFFDNVTLTHPHTWRTHPSWENDAYKNADRALPTILFLRDSFASFGGHGGLMQYIPQHFGKTILIHYLNAEHLEEYLAFYEPDIVVLEIAERSIPTFVNSVLATLPDLGYTTQ